ncbi:RNA polymerase sigma factor [Pedobacter sp. ASV12]|uniref:RNA polymerase sigma factor n=1 Tax=Pedobacter sp. ASV12 TaxID=2795120 RepID=UPI0018EA5619|nr:sigma-70 family RNA polymerase sigma factor [Pedobacter sp. ASV12]
MELNYRVLNDEDLIGLIKLNDGLALECLFNRYYQSLCRFIAIHLKDYSRAEELIADLFIKLWDNRSTQEIRSVKAYLFIAAKNMAINHAQRPKNKIDYCEDYESAVELPHTGPNPFDIISSKEAYHEMMQLIWLLPERQREVLLMSRLEDLDKNNIAAILGISVRTVETTLYQAIKTLQHMVKTSPNQL